MREGRTQTEREAAYAGSRLKPTSALGRPRLIGQPSSRTGENPPYGMIGGIEETSASFEARSAPRSYPTEGWGWRHPHLLGNRLLLEWGKAADRFSQGFRIVVLLHVGDG